MTLNKKSLADQIKNELFSRIVNLEIRQGEKINVSELEKEFGVSRAPVREALQGLAEQGLVEVRPRVGYFAVELTPGQIKDICELRKLLETFALKNSFEELPKPELENLLRESLNLQKSLNLQCTGMPPQELRTQFDTIDEKLHKMIIVYTDNELLREFTKRIHNLVALTRHMNERINKAIEEHIVIIDSIIEGDKEKAVESLRNHLDSVQRESLEKIMQE